MNQSILFDDEVQWNEADQSVRFTAQQMGALIECIIPRSSLENLSGLRITEQAHALSAFELCRFDIEETAERLIDDEEYDSQGRVILSSII